MEGHIVHLQHRPYEPRKRQHRHGGHTEDEAKYLPLHRPYRGGLQTGCTLEVVVEVFVFPRLVDAKGKLVEGSQIPGLRGGGDLLGGIVDDERVFLSVSEVSGVG